MKKINKGNPNHPPKGSRITVDPIRDEKHIKQIKRRLKRDNARDYLLFTMGINNGLRIGDLLNLKIKDVAKLKHGEAIKIIEQKTGKENILMINSGIYEALQSYLKERNSPAPEEYLFQSRKKDHVGDSKSLSREAVASLVKSWTEDMKGNYSTHSLRKTWGYMQRVKFGVSFEIICKRFGHSNPAITMRYLGIEDKEVEQILLNEI